MPLPPVLVNRLKLGVIIQHFDARNDVRELVGLLAREHEVVLFGEAGKLRPIDAGCEKRAFLQQRRLRDRVALQAFNLVGSLPASRNNYAVTELFKLSNLPALHRRLAALRLRLRMQMPSLMTFDQLLNHLEGSDATLIDDIDRFLVITELSNAPFLARVLKAHKPVDAYVYSWDHACKHLTFSQRIDRWLVWHEGIAEDLVDLQGIMRDRIEVSGATQLAYIHEYLASPESRKRRIDQRYVYFGCGVGQPEMARQEVRLIGFLAEVLQEVDPSIRCIVRPYPMLAATDFFQELRRRPNVEFDDAYRVGSVDRSLSREAIFERLNLQEHACAFVHCGTTMGLEGAYFDSPLLFLALDDFDFGLDRRHPLHLSRFIHQYHNDKYMILDGYPNVVRRASVLPAVLRAMLDDPAVHLPYNREIARHIPLLGLDAIARRLVPQSPSKMTAAITPIIEDLRVAGSLR